MEYTALYRKLRPKSFEQVIGQEHIVKTLQNQFSTDRINHAYLFCGTRGTGKTSTAKIFAKLLNCENPSNLIPCDNCEMCNAFNENRSLNVIEIDAASNNGVDDIRNIREEVKYPPTKGFYKVYIIDEVHMLSIGAFNALLKTLEEPPRYVVFILATTDPQKIPVTILSRCQRFNFRRINNSDIFQHIKKYVEEENIDIEDKALNYIAKLSDGAMRDALSILDQCISFYFDQKITLDKVMDITNSVDDEVLFVLTEALINFNVEICLIVIDEIILQGRDIDQFNYELIAHFRNLLVVSISKNNLDVIDLPEEKITRLQAQAEKINTENIIKFINTFSEIQPVLKQSFNNRVIFETCCIKLCTAVSENDLTDVFNKIAIIENKIEGISNNAIYFNKNQDTNSKQENSDLPQPKRELAISEDFKLVIQNWSKITNKFEGLEKVVLERCIPNNLEDKFLYIICKDEVNLRIVIKIKDKLEEVLGQTFNKSYTVLPIYEKEFNLKHSGISNSYTKEISDNEINEDISSKIDFKVDFN